MRKKRLTASLALMLIVLLIPLTFVSCSRKIEIATQPSIITAPYKYNLKAKKQESELLDAKYPIDWEKDDPKEIVEKAWNNMQFAPYTLYRQTGDVSTITLGMTVIQSVSTIRYSERKPDKEGTDDSGRPGLEQNINYMSSYSVTSQGIAGVDIRLMCESLRTPNGQYTYRQAVEAKNIKLDPNTAKFYNLSGKWQEFKNLKSLQAYSTRNKDNPNNILAYNVKKDSISSATKESNDFKGEDYKDKPEYTKLAEDIESKKVPNVYVIKVDFNDQTWKDLYIKIMYDMLHLGGQDGVINYKGLKMKLEIWENGFIRQLDFEESYQLELGPINAEATLESNLQISYSPIQEMIVGTGENQKTLVVTWRREYMNKYGKNFSDKRKPPKGVDMASLK